MSIPLTSELKKEGRLSALRDALDSGTLRQAHRMVNSLHPAEIALLLESLPPQQREVVWEFVDPELEGSVLVELSDGVRQALIERQRAFRQAQSTRTARRLPIRTSCTAGSGRPFRIRLGRTGNWPSSPI